MEKYRRQIVIPNADPITHSSPLTKTIGGVAVAVAVAAHKVVAYMKRKQAENIEFACYCQLGSSFSFSPWFFLRANSWFA